MAQPSLRRGSLTAYLESLEAKKKLSDPIIPEDDPPPGVNKFPPKRPGDFDPTITNPPRLPHIGPVPAYLDIFF